MKLKKVWPFFLSVFLVFVFFWKFFLKGLSPIPSDIIVGMYFPWLDYKWGYAVGVPVKNNLLSDTVSQFWVWRNLAIDLLKSGQNPFWNPYALSGSPLVPIFHSSFFSPFNIFFWLVDRVKAMSLIIIFQPLLAMVFMYLFLQTFKISKLSSIFGGIIFAFSGFMLAWLEWGNIGHTLLWLPFLLWLAELFISRKKIVILVIQIIALGICLSAGHPQTFFYCFLTWFLYLVYRLAEERTLRPWLIPLIISILFFLCFSFLLVPGLESYWYSIRATEGYIKQSNYGFFPMFHFITFLAPDFFGNPTTGNWWGRGFNYQELIGYFGIIPLVFVLFSFSLRDKKTYFWKIFFLVSLGFAFQYPLGWLIYFFRVPLLSTSSASRILCLTSFAGAILASFGLEAAKEKKIVNFFGFFYPFWVLLASYGTGALYSYYSAYSFKGKFLNVPEANKIVSTLMAQTKVGLRNLILPITLLFVAQIVLILINILAKKEKKGWIKNLLLVLILVLTTGELFRFGWKYNSFVKPDFYFPQMEILDKIKQKAANWRIERERGEILPPNMWIPYKLFSSSGYDPVYPLSYSKFLTVLNGGKINDSGIGRYAEIENYQDPLFDFLGIKYILTIKKDNEDKISVSGEPNYKFQIQKFSKIYDSGSVVVLENRKAFSRVYMVSKFELAKNDLEASAKIIKNSNNLSKTVILTERVLPQTISEGKKDLSSCKSDILNYESGKIIIETDCLNKGFLILTDTFFPGWKAIVDGEKAKIFKANLSFRAVYVSEGKHTVTFAYQPESYRISLLITVISWLVLGIMARKIKAGKLILQRNEKKN